MSNQHKSYLMCNEEAIHEEIKLNSSIVDCTKKLKTGKFIEDEIKKKCSGKNTCSLDLTDLGLGGSSGDKYCDKDAYFFI